VIKQYYELKIPCLNREPLNVQLYFILLLVGPSCRSLQSEVGSFQQRLIIIEQENNL